MPNDSASGVVIRLGPGLPVFRFPQLTPAIHRIAAASQGLIVAGADLAALGAATLLGASVRGRLAGPWAISLPHGVRDILSVTDPGRAGYGFAVVLLVLLAQFGGRGHYANRSPAWSRTQDIIMAVALAALCDLFLVLPEAGGTRAAGWLVMWLSLVPLIIASRSAARFAMAKLGLWDIRIVLFGAPEHTARAAEAMRSESRSCLRVVGHFQRHELADAADPAHWRGLMARTGGNYIALVGAPADASHEARAMVALERSGIPFARRFAGGAMAAALFL
jgi:hypothetical protein